MRQAKWFNTCTMYTNTLYPRSHGTSSQLWYNLHPPSYIPHSQAAIPWPCEVNLASTENITDKIQCTHHLNTDLCQTFVNLLLSIKFTSMTIVVGMEISDCVLCHGKSHTSIEVLLCAQQTVNKPCGWVQREWV